MSVDPSLTVQARLEALALYDVMDTAAESEFDAIARAASQICGTPIATVTLLDDHRQWFKARIGVDATETPIEQAFCAHAIQKPGEIMVVRDALEDQRFMGNPLVVDGPKIRFYAGAPMVTPEGIPIGTVCAIDTQARGLLTNTQSEALQALSRQAMALLEAARWRAAFRKSQVKCGLLEVSEAYFRHLTEHALDLITILEPDGTIRFESRSIERELGYTPAHYRGRNAFEFVHPDDRPAVTAAFVEALQQHGNTPVIRFRFLHSDGSYRLLEGTGNNLLDDAAVRGVVFNSRDITERVRLQEEVELGREEKEETIARLTGGVAHDFNNILAAIQGLAELTALQLAPGTTAARHLADIQVATARAASLTQQLLAFSRRLVLQPRVLPLAGWLRELEPRLALLLGSSIQLKMEIPSEIQAWEDPAMLEQVICHLAVNARDAMPAGGRFAIEASLVVSDLDERPQDESLGMDSHIRLVVSDQGCGMTESTLARIFEPFFTTKTDGHHPGLGLSMCRGIIEQSGGRLTVSSQPGRGTVFQICLPTQDMPATALAPSVPPSAISIVESPLQATILLVDDEPMLREIGETILMEAGYRVLVAEDGPDALARLDELGSSPLDLLLTDVVMPGMNGVQLAEEVGRRRPGTRVLLCSGYTRDALAHSAGLPPGVDFLPKPYTLKRLLEKVSEVLDNSALQELAACG